MEEKEISYQQLGIPGIWTLPSIYSQLKPIISKYEQLKDHAKNDFERGAFEEQEAEEISSFLCDKNFEILTGKIPHPKMNETNSKIGLPPEPVIPYRIIFPSKRIIDQKEIYKEVSELEKIGFTKDEILSGRIFWETIQNHPDLGKWNGPIFSEYENVEKTKEKYKESPIEAKEIFNIKYKFALDLLKEDINFTERFPEFQELAPFYNK
jgi:hypothetical protein